MASSRMRRKTSTRVINKVGKRHGRRALLSASRDTGARWPGLALPLVASLGAFVAYKVPGTGVGLKALRGVTGVGAATFWATQLFVRPWQLTWGATDTELRHPMPGDELIATPWLEATRAITIDAPAQVIWPWLQRINILPESLGSGLSMEQMESRRALVVASQGGEVTASFLLEPLSEEHTRLVARIRMARPSTARGLLAYFLVDRDFATARNQLLALKAQAEAEWLRGIPAIHEHPLQSPSAPEPAEEELAHAIARPEPQGPERPTPGPAGTLVEG